MASEQQSESASSEQPPATAATVADKPKGNWPISQRWRMVIAGGLVVVLAVGLWAWRRYAIPVLPQGQRTVQQRQGTAKQDQRTAKQAQGAVKQGQGLANSTRQYAVLAAAEANRSKSPSIPGLEKGVPQLVPGLENIDKAWTISLSHDSCTIVIDAETSLKSQHTLCIATRPNVSSPFSDLHEIRSSASGKPQRPALSPNALELIFMRVEGAPRFFCCRRPSKSSEFGEPVAWPVPGVAREGSRLLMARFLDPLHVLLSAENIDSKPRFSFFVAERADPEGAFGPATEISMGAVGGWLCLRPHRLIAYFGTPQGLFVLARTSEAEPFGQGVRLFDSAVCGPVIGAIWVAPGDDVAFYCSPGPGKEWQGVKKIWMVRF